MRIWQKKHHTDGKSMFKCDPAVNILGFNAPEWHISAVACVAAGGLTAGIYTTNSIDATRYVAEHSRCNIMVVEDEEQYNKIDAIWERLPELQAVVQYTGGEPI